MADEAGSVPELADDFIALLGRQDDAEARLVQARGARPLAYALVMAAMSWDRVDQRGWRAPAVLGAQARRLMVAWGVPTESVDDADQVGAALEWAGQDPALVEYDGQGHCRPVYGVGFPVGSQLWREHHHAAVVSGVLTPLELVAKGDADRDAREADLDAAEVWYRLAGDSDDPDAAALALLRLAGLAELRDQPTEAARQYADVEALRHPVVSPPAALWLARRAFQNGDRPAARALAQEVVDSGDGRLIPDAWGVLAIVAWHDEDREGAVAAMRLAVDTAGEWHWSFSRSLGEMLAACGDPAGAADAYRRLLNQPLLSGTDADRYVQLMVMAGRVDEAVTVLEGHIADGEFLSGDLLLALASVHAARDDLEATRETLARVRAHWSVVLPKISVRADVMEASVATAAGDDERAAQLFRSVTDTDDTERRDLARPLLIAAGDHFAADGKLCVIPGARPLLEYLCEAAAPATAAWAASSLAHLATVEGRPDDAEAAVRLAARHLSPEEVTVLRACLLYRAGRDRDAFTYLIDATATSPALTALLSTKAGRKDR